MNTEFQYFLESRSINKNMPKSCIDLRFTNDPNDPESDLQLVLTNNCQLRFCLNSYSVFTLASKLSEAVLKENIETSYYKEVAKAALSKIDQYIQVGLSYAVFPLLYTLIEKYLRPS